MCANNVPVYVIYIAITQTFGCSKISSNCNTIITYIEVSIWALMFNIRYVVDADKAFHHLHMLHSKLTG